MAEPRESDNRKLRADGAIDPSTPDGNAAGARKPDPRVPCEPEWAAADAVAARQGGLLTRRQARELGITARQERRLVRLRIWRRWAGLVVIPHVRVDGHSGAAPGAGVILAPSLRDLRLGWMCRLRCGPDAVLTGTLAARLAGVDMLDSCPMVAVGRRVSRQLADVRVLRTKAGPPPGSTVHLHGLRVRRWPHCLVDALTRGSRAAPLELVDLALQRRWLSPLLLQTEGATRPQWWSHGVRAVAHLHRIVAAGTRSEAERRMATLLRQSQLEGWSPNHPIKDEHGRRLAEIDFAHPETMLAIEVDGAAHHSDGKAFERDRARQTELLGRGWHTMRFTWKQITSDPRWVISSVRRALARARSSPSRA